MESSTSRVEPRYPRVVLASVSVPWNDRGEVIEDVFRRQIQVHLEAGIGHLYIFGTAGEGYAVTERLFDEISRIFVDEMAGPDAHPMIGLISHSMGTIIERIERSIDLGARSFQFALPSWGTLNDRELATFFREVLGRFPAGGIRPLQPAAVRARPRTSPLRAALGRASEPRRLQERHEQHRPHPRPDHEGARAAVLPDGARLSAGLPIGRTGPADVADDAQSGDSGCSSSRRACGATSRR